jgi:HPt (histidine-containing phosphotransfer) domain-containing protein
MLRAQNAHMTTGPCAALLERVGGDEEIFLELCDVFLDDAPRRLASIRLALENGDAVALRREAHALRGEAAAFDAADVVTVARQIEQLAAAGDVRQAHPLWEVLDAHSRRLIAAVRGGRETR